MSRSTAIEYLEACHEAGLASGVAGVQLDRWMAARQADALDRIAAALEAGLPYLKLASERQT